MKSNIIDVMVKLNLHIANANKKFTEDEQRMVRDAVTAAELLSIVTLTLIMM